MIGRIRLRLLSLFGPAIALAVLVAACGGGDPTATPVPTPTSAPASTATPIPTATPDPTSGDVVDAKYGGTLIKTVSGDPATWDGHRERSLNTHGTTMPVYDTLVRRNPFDHNVIVSSLAESWDVSSDGLTWTFNIRSGVRFHNGDPLTAEDIRYTYDVVVQNPPEDVASVYKGQLGAAATITAPDDTTLVITLDGLDAAFLVQIGHGRLAVYSKKLVEAEGRERTTEWPPVGAGPFKALEDGWNRDISTEIVRNEDYWEPTRPFLDSLKEFVIPDRGTAFAAFLSGQVNFGPALTVAQEQDARSRLGDRLTIQETVTVGPRILAFNTTMEPFNDIRLRRAVTLALDKRETQEFLAPGRGLPGGGFLVPGTEFALSDQQLLAFDGYSPDKQANLAKARELMAQAGYGDGGLTISLLTRNSTSYIDMSTVLLGALEEIGIEAEINLLESGRYFENRSADSSALQVVLVQHSLAGLDPNEVYRDFFLPGGVRTYHGLVNDPTLLAMFEAQKGVLDAAKRLPLVQDMEKHALGLYAASMIGRSKAANAMYSFIKNYQFASESTHFNRQYRDVWFDQ